MDQMIGGTTQQGWNGSGNDNQNTNYFQKLSQTERLNQHEDRKRKYQEFYGKGQTDQTVNLPTNQQRFTHTETSNYTRIQKGDTVFIESKEKYRGSGSPVEGYVFSTSAKEVNESSLNTNTNQQPNHTRYPNPQLIKTQTVDKSQSTSTNSPQTIPVNSQGREQKQWLAKDKPQPSTETKKPLIQPYFQQDNHCLYQADCVEVMKQFPDNYVDMIFADPPYFLSEPDEAREVTNFPVKDLKFKNGENKGGYDNYKGERDVSRGFKSNLQFQHNWIKEARRILKPEGTIWITGTHHSIYMCGFAVQNLGYKILNEISWYKPKSKYNPKNYFNFSHETIIWARKSKDNKNHRHYFNEKLMSRWRGDPLKDSNPENSQSMRTVWQIHPPTKKETVHGRHPTQKPLQLLQRIILASTKPDAIILDPFNGSGTTGVAIETVNRGLKRAGKWDKNTKGRRYIGIDRESEYLEVTRRRLGAFGSGK